MPKYRIAIKKAINKIIDCYPQLAIHLKNSIETGFECIYKPEKRLDWKL